MSTETNPLTKATLFLRKEVNAPWEQNIAIEGKEGPRGPQGTPGVDGVDGKTYTPVLREVDGEVFVDFYTDENVVVGTINIKGTDGVNGVNGLNGNDGKTYSPVLREEEGKVYLDFVEGDTTISGAVNLKGEKGDAGDPGAPGTPGANGKSAYEIAVENGYEGTEEAYTEMVTSVPENAQKAEDAKNEAETARDEAVIALNNGCVYEVRDITDANLALDKTLTAYKHTPTSDTTYTFATPTEAQGKIVVFWLWIVMGDTAHTLSFPSNVTWISEPSLGANTQCMLALMSVDNGTSWQANVQWEA